MLILPAWLLPFSCRNIDTINRIGGKIKWPAGHADQWTESSALFMSMFIKQLAVLERLFSLRKTI